MEEIIKQTSIDFIKWLHDNEWINVDGKLFIKLKLDTKYNRVENLYDEFYKQYKIKND